MMLCPLPKRELLSSNDTSTMEHHCNRNSTVSMISTETPEILRIDSNESDCSTLLALKQKVRELDNILEDLGDRATIEDEEDGMNEELYTLEYSEKLLRQELDAIDMMLAPALSKDQPEEREYDISCLFHTEEPEIRSPAPFTSVLEDCNLVSCETCDFGQLYTPSRHGEEIEIVYDYDNQITTDLMETPVEKTPKQEGRGVHGSSPPQITKEQWPHAQQKVSENQRKRPQDLFLPLLQMEPENEPPTHSTSNASPMPNQQQNQELPVTPKREETVSSPQSHGKASEGDFFFCSDGICLVAYSPGSAIYKNELCSIPKSPGEHSTNSSIPLSPLSEASSSCFLPNAVYATTQQGPSMSPACSSAASDILYQYHKNRLSTVTERGIKSATIQKPQLGQVNSQEDTVEVLRSFSESLFTGIEEEHSSDLSHPLGINDADNVKSSIFGFSELSIPALLDSLSGSLNRDPTKSIQSPARIFSSTSIGEGAKSPEVYSSSPETSTRSTRLRRLQATKQKSTQKNLHVSSPKSPRSNIVGESTTTTSQIGSARSLRRRRFFHKPKASDVSTCKVHDDEGRNNTITPVPTSSSDLIDLRTTQPVAKSPQSAPADTLDLQSSVTGSCYDDPTSPVVASPVSKMSASSYHSAMSPRGVLRSTIQRKRSDVYSPKTTTSAGSIHGASTRNQSLSPSHYRLISKHSTKTCISDALDYELKLVGSIDLLAADSSTIIPSECDDGDNTKNISDTRMPSNLLENLKFNLELAKSKSPTNDSATNENAASCMSPTKSPNQNPPTNRRRKAKSPRNLSVQESPTDDISDLSNMVTLPKQKGLLSPRRKLCLEADNIYSNDYGEIQTGDERYIISPLNSFLSVLGGEQQQDTTRGQRQVIKNLVKKDTLKASDVCNGVIKHPNGNAEPDDEQTALGSGTIEKITETFLSVNGCFSPRRAEDISSDNDKVEICKREEPPPLSLPCDSMFSGNQSSPTSTHPLQQNDFVNKEMYSEQQHQVDGRDITDVLGRIYARTQVRVRTQWENNGDADDDSVKMAVTRIATRIQNARLKNEVLSFENDSDSVKEAVRRVATLVVEEGEDDDDELALKETLTRIASRIEEAKTSPPEDIEDGPLFSCFDGAIECVVAPCFGGTAIEDTSVILQTYDSSVEEGENSIRDPFRDEEIELKPKYLKNEEAYVTGKVEQEAIDRRNFGSHKAIKPIKNIDVCITCLSPKPPKLPLREELQSLGVELIYHNTGLDPEGKEPTRTTLHEDPDDDATDENDRDSIEKQQPFESSCHSVQSLDTQHNNTEKEIKKLLARNKKLLQSIVQFEYDSYKEVTTSDLTGIGPGYGHVDRSQSFHRYHFENKNARKVPTSVSMLSPCVRFLPGGVAVTSYVRLDQFIHDGQVSTSRTNETRVWENQKEKWFNCHFHQS